MDSEKLIEASAKLAEALKDNPAADSFIALLTWVAIALFVYFFTSMIFDKFHKSRADTLLNTIDDTLRENVRSLNKVTTALERLEDK